MAEADLSARLDRTGPSLRAIKAHELFEEVRAHLFKAQNADRLVTPVQIIREEVKWVRAPKEAPKDAKGIAGGIKDSHRHQESARLIRPDGWWFHFTITVNETPDGLDVMAYNFELVMPDVVPGFIRFDLNLPDHRNVRRDLRSHLHPGHDDILVPAPILDPIEALNLMISLAPMR